MATYGFNDWANRSLNASTDASLLGMRPLMSSSLRDSRPVSRADPITTTTTTMIAPPTVTTPGGRTLGGRGSINNTSASAHKYDSGSRGAGVASGRSPTQKDVDDLRERQKQLEASRAQRRMNTAEATREHERTLLDLDVTTANLNNIRVAEQQAAQATRALQLDLQDARNEVGLSTKNVDSLRRELKLAQHDFRAQLDALRADNDLLQTRLDDKVHELVQVRRQLDETLRELRLKEEAVHFRNEVSERLESDITLAKSRWREAQDDADNLREELAEKEDLVQRLDGQCAMLSDRNAVLLADVAHLEALIDECRQTQEKNERETNFNVSIVEQSKAALSTEMELMQKEAADRIREIGRLKGQMADMEVFAERLRAELRAREDDYDKQLREARHWKEEAQRLQNDVEGTRQHEFATRKELESQMVTMRNEANDLLSKQNAARVQASVAESAKTDLTQELNRVNKRLAARDAEVAKLTRLLEERDQLIAELRPVAKDAQRAATHARVAGARSAGGWKY